MRPVRTTPVPPEATVAAPQGQKALSRRGLRGHGRAAVLWGLGLFVLSQVALRAYIETRKPELRDPTFEIKYRQLARRLAECPRPPVKVIFFGSSMTAHGINAGLLEAPLSRALNRPVVAFNLGIPSSGPLSQQLFLRRLLRRGVRPDLAVIELTPLVYDNPDCPADVWLFPGHRLAHREVPLVQAYAQDPDLWPAWWEAFLVPAYGHRLAILNYEAQFLLPYDDWLHTWRAMDANGWAELRVYDPERHREALEGVKAEDGPRLAAFKAGEPPLRALAELLDLLQKERVPALLVRMPEGPLLRSLYAEGPHEALMQEFATLSHRHGFPLVNARDWLGEELFTDSYHANGEGARVLTERLGRQTLVPLLAGRYDAPQLAGNRQGRPGPWLPWTGQAGR